jgi:DNA-binding CsgD family transcriptional regulator
MDDGAEAILSSLNRSGSLPDSLRLPEEILSLLAEHSDGDLQDASSAVSVAGHEYGFRIFRMKASSDTAMRPTLALYLRRESSIADAVLHAGADYRLTDREQQALIGMTMGLTSKELAAQMNISPNTVKAYLRLIMIKMGVTTRAGIVGKLLDQNKRPNGAGA